MSEDGPCTSALWASATWRVEALGWADERLGAVGSTEWDEHPRRWLAEACGLA